MLGWVLLAVFFGFLVGAAGVIGFLELGYRIGRRRRVQYKSGNVGSNGHGLSLDSRERRRIIQRELDKLRR